MENGILLKSTPVIFDGFILRVRNFFVVVVIPGPLPPSRNQSATAPNLGVESRKGGGE